MWESDGTTPRLHEQFGYAYDAAWNLNQRTNDALVQTFTVNSLNELTRVVRNGTLTVAGNASEPKGGYSYWGYPPGVTNVTVNGSNALLYADGSFAATNFAVVIGTNPFTAVAQDTYGRVATNAVNPFLPLNDNMDYDLNGNLLQERSAAGGTNRCFAYDDENQLVAVWVANVWSNSFAYDGMNRRRITREYQWDAGTSGWVKTNEVRYVYDVNLVIQERDANNLPLVTYTRGNDLSHSLQDAGGIGGLLARTDNGLMIGGSPWATAYYFSDGNGNVMNLVYTNGAMAAQYTYDPFGGMLTMSGPLAGPNKYRHASKEWNENSGLYYYGGRYYDPILQRWVNRDPIQEWGGINLYDFVGNDPINLFDPYGYDDCGRFGVGTDSNAESLGNKVKNGLNATANVRKAASVIGAGNAWGNAVNLANISQKTEDANRDNINSLDPTSDAGLESMTLQNQLSNAIPTFNAASAVAPAAGKTFCSAAGFLGGFKGIGMELTVLIHGSSPPKLKVPTAPDTKPPNPPVTGPAPPRSLIINGNNVISGGPPNSPPPPGSLIIIMKP